MKLKFSFIDDSVTICHEFANMPPILPPEMSRATGLWNAISNRLTNLYRKPCGLGISGMRIFSLATEFLAILAGVVMQVFTTLSVAISWRQNGEAYRNYVLPLIPLSAHCTNPGLLCRYVLGVHSTCLLLIRTKDWLCWRWMTISDKTKWDGWHMVAALMPLNLSSNSWCILKEINIIQICDYAVHTTFKSI